MKRSIVLIISCLLFGVVASAQPQKVIEKEFERFTTVKVQDNFIVKFVNSDKYSVRINVDERIASHVQAYEKSGILYLILDEKGYTKELKKELKQKGAAQPALEAVIYMPEIKSLIFTDKVLVKHSDELKSDNFTLTATDNVKIQHLKVSCVDADLNVSKTAEVSVEMKVQDNLKFETANSANVVLVQQGGNSSLKLGGSSAFEMKADVQELSVEAVSGVQAQISGAASELKVNASSYSRTDAELLDAKTGHITMTGSSKCHVNVAEKMIINITSGAMLTFKRTPIIEVERVLNASVLKADDPKRK